MICYNIIQKLKSLLCLSVVWAKIGFFCWKNAYKEAKKRRMLISKTKLYYYLVNI